MLRRVLLASLVLGLGACASGPVEGCADGTKLVGDTCRPSCSGDEQCLVAESCVDGACVPRSGGGDDASAPAPDALPAPADASVEPVDSGERDAGLEEPKDAEPTSPDAAPNRDAEPMSPDAMPRDSGRSGPDLFVRNPGAAASPILVEERFPISAEVHNGGDRGTGGQTQLALFLNPVGVTGYVQGTSTLIGTEPFVNLGPMASRVQTVYGSVPDTEQPGPRQLILVVDPQGIVAETDETNNVVDLGRVEVTTITVTRDQINFGELSVNCGEAEQNFSIVNRGASAVSILRMSLPPGSAFSFDGNAGPFNINANGQQRVTVTYRAQAQPGPASATLEITHMQPGSPLRVSLSGQTVATVTHTFPPPHARAADVLIVVDDSGGSMGFGMQVPSLFAALAGIDYRVGVISALELVGAIGVLRGNPTYVTPQTPNGEGEIISRVSQTPPIVPLPNVGFQAIDGVLSNALQGFVRENAWLYVLVVSETDDASRMEASDLARTLAASKSGTQGIAVVSVIVPTSMGNNDYAVRYIELAQLTGGVLASMEDVASWSTAIDPIRGPRFGARFRFLLPTAPDPSSISLAMSGVAVARDAWFYDSMRNEVRLRGNATPTAMDTLALTYTPACQ